MIKILAVLITLVLVTGCVNEETDYEKCSNRDPGNYETIEEYEKAIKDCQEFQLENNNNW